MGLMQDAEGNAEVTSLASLSGGAPLAALIAYSNWGGSQNTDYASSGAAAEALKEWQAYQAKQEIALNSNQSQTNDLAGYSNTVSGNQNFAGSDQSSQTDSIPGFAPPILVGTPYGSGTIYSQGAPATVPDGYTAVQGTTSQGAQVDSQVIGYNPSNQGTGYQSLQGYTGETPSGGGEVYTPPVPFTPSNKTGWKGTPGYIDYGSDYNAQTNPDDFLFFSTYQQALIGESGFRMPIYDSNGNITGYGSPGPLGLQNGTISYGSAPENSLQGTPGNGDPTLNGIDYSQGASYANEAANGVGTYTPGTTGTAENGGIPAHIVPYTQYTEPGYIAPTATAAGPTSIQSYDAQGESMTPDAATSAGTEGTFLYGNNGSAGTLSGTFSNSTPGQATTFYQSEPGSLTNDSNAPGSGTFSGQPNAGPTMTPATDTSSNYFTYPTLQPQSASTGFVNQATGGVAGPNPLGLDQTNQSTLSGTDSALGYSGTLNPITGQTDANTNQTNTSLQALTNYRQANNSVGFS